MIIGIGLELGSNLLRGFSEWISASWEKSRESREREKKELCGTRSDKAHHRFPIPDHAEMLTILL